MYTWTELCNSRLSYEKNTQRRNNIDKEMERKWTRIKGETIRRFATQGYIPEPIGGIKT